MHLMGRPSSYMYDVVAESVPRHTGCIEVAPVKYRTRNRTADTATKSLPTTKVLTEFLFYQANVKSDATALKDRVRELITGPDGHLELVSGDEWADAVSGAVAVAVGDMMADLESASTVERQLWYVMGLGFCPIL